MIIFYNKDTGKIEGTIEGRIHSDEQMKMWIGDKKKNDRIIFEWEKIDGKWQPDVEDEKTKEALISLDKRETRIKDYIIKSKKFRKKRKVIDGIT